MTEKLPALMDNRQLREELGITEAAADAIMRRLDTIKPEGVRKLYVRRADVIAYLDNSTVKRSA